MSLEDSLAQVIHMYEAIIKEMRDFKAGEYKQGVADGMELVLAAVKNCLDE
jgi:hypothetical protein